MTALLDRLAHARARRNLSWKIPAADDISTEERRWLSSSTTRRWPG